MYDTRCVIRICHEWCQIRSWQRPHRPLACRCVHTRRLERRRTPREKRKVQSSVDFKATRAESRLAQRRPSRRIRLGTVDIGDGAPISIQSMTTTKTEDVAATLIQAHALATQGADIVRVAVPHEADARALPTIVAQAGVPIVADVHFSYRLALLALEAGVQGLRLNPGNIRDAAQIRTVVREAKARGVPIRVGANAGSLDKALLARHGGPTPKALVESALAEVAILEDEGFDDIKIS